MVIESPNIVKNPVISVIVTTYNHESYLRQCLDSILSQKLSVFYELIIADDCSTDGTQNICKEYQSHYPDIIRLVLNEQNQGLILNYRQVLSLCRGHYIAQIAGDDYWYDCNKLQLQYDALEQHIDCDLCYTNCFTCDKNGILDKSLLVKHEQTTFEHHLLCAGYIAPGAWMFRSKVRDYMDLQEWFTDESFAVALDVMHHSKLYFIDKPTYVYRIRKGSASSPKDTEHLFRYCKGIFDLQLYYAFKYSCAKEFVEKLSIKGYLQLLPIAVLAEKNDYVEEIRKAMRNMDLDVDLIIRDLKAGERRKHSHAYKLGKKILAPLSWWRKRNNQ